MMIEHIDVLCNVSQDQLKLKKCLRMNNNNEKMNLVKRNGALMVLFVSALGGQSMVL